jgi:hypothetical protein
VVGRLVRGIFSARQRLAEGRLPRAALLAVYRRINSPNVVPLVRETLRLGGTVALWALDAPAEALASWTVGVGPGSRMELLNRLLPRAVNCDWLVIADDDVRVIGGSLGLFLYVAEKARFAFAQPAHSERSYRSHPITLRWPGAVARLTSFVEVGPLVAIRRPWLDSVIPFPPGMGWGVDVGWTDLMGRGARFGIVDIVAICHLTPSASAYAREDEQARLERALRSRHVHSLGELQSTLAVWRPWQKKPRW